MIGSVGPNVSSVMHFIEWLTPVKHRGLVETTRTGAAVAAGGDLAPLSTASLDVVVDDVELRAERDRTDLDAAGAAGGGALP